jgi:hypothetical protein
MLNFHMTIRTMDGRQLENQADLIKLEDFHTTIPRKLDYDRDHEHQAPEGEIENVQLQEARWKDLSIEEQRK